MNFVKRLPRNRSANKELAEAINAAALVSIDEDLDDVTDEVMREEERSGPPSLGNLRLERPIGLGGQGGVWLAVCTASGVRCAVKEVRKGRLAALPRKSATRVFTEREALLECRHPFITRLHGTFQDAQSLYFVMELAGGGDMFALLDLNPRGMPEPSARFYAASVALALRHVHSHGYVYRDVKLENVLIGADGYVKLCDFGFAKRVADDRTWTKCGTDEYAPPEVVTGKGRSTAADWWGLGVLLHEMLTGRPPFEGRSGQDIYHRIEEYTKGGAKAQERMLSLVSRTCSDLSAGAYHFLSGLLRAKETERIGAGPSGFIGIQRDAWFATLDWGALLRRQLPPPWTPPPSGDGAAASDADIAGDDVMAPLPFDVTAWAPIFAEFGPTLATPLASLGVQPTPMTACH